MVADPLVMPMAREMLDCLAQEVAKVDSPPAYVQLRPGTTVDQLISQSQDECCQGLAWVRPDTFFPSSAVFPQIDEIPPRTGVKSWAVTLELGAIRCAPVGDQDVLPTGAEWDAVTQAVMDDAAAMRRAICCFIDARPGRAARVLPGAWGPITVEGGCVGGLIPVTISGPACDCADAGPES